MEKTERLIQWRGVVVLAAIWIYAVEGPIPRLTQSNPKRLCHLAVAALTLAPAPSPGSAANTPSDLSASANAILPEGLLEAVRATLGPQDTHTVAIIDDDYSIDLPIVNRGFIGFIIFELQMGSPTYTTDERGCRTTAGRLALFGSAAPAFFSGACSFPSWQRSLAVIGLLFILYLSACTPANVVPLTQPTSTAEVEISASTTPMVSERALPDEWHVNFVLSGGFASLS